MKGGVMMRSKVTGRGTCHEGTSDAGGFSLIELLVLLLIIAILAFTLIPRIKTATGFRLPLAAEKVARDLRYARQKAMDTRVPYGLDFAAPDNYWVFRSYSATFAVDPLTRGNYDVWLDTGDFAGVTISSATFGAFDSVRFDPSGTPSSGGSVVLTAGGSTRTVSLEAGTGKVD